MHTQRGILAMIASMAMFIVNDALVKVVSARLPTDQIIFLRGLAACAMVLVLLLIIHPHAFRLISSPGIRLVGVRATVDAVSTFAYLWALFKMPLPNITAINLSAPLMVTALAVMFLGEQVAWRRWSAISAGFVGVLLVIQPQSDAFNQFSLVALAATLAHATRDLMTRFIAAEIPNLLVTLATALAVTVIAGLSVAVSGWAAVRPDDLLLLVAAAVFLVGGYHLIIVAMRLAEASRVAPFRYTAILWALILGYVVWGDVPDRLALAGIVILIASGLYLMHRERKLKAAAMARANH